MRFTIRMQMAITAFALGSLVGVTSYFGIQSVTRIHNVYDTIVDVELPAVNALYELRRLTIEIRSKTLLYQEDLKYVAYEKSDDQKSILLADLNKIIEAENDYFHAESVERKAYNETKPAANQSITSARQEMVGSVVDLVSLKERGTPEAVLKAKKIEVTEKQSQLANIVNEALEEKRQSILISDERADNETIQVGKNSSIIVGLSLAIAIGIGLLIAATFSRRVKKLEEGTAHIAAGDFSYKVVIKGRDELTQLAESFNQMSNRFQDSYRRLAFAKQRDEALIESMSEGLIAVDEDGKVVLLNKVAADLFALPDREIATGKPLSDIAKIYDQRKHLIHHADHPAYMTLKSGKSNNGVYSYKSLEGYRLLNVSANPVILEDKVAGTIVILRDVTKEKEIDRMKTEFISLASHQLRTPLSAIKWFTEMLLGGDAGKMTAEQKDFTKNISDSAERMIDLVNSLLNISRMESGRIIVDPKPTDLNELVSGIVNDLKAKTEEKQQTLVISVHKDLKKINLDPHLIGQVYMNFLTNAIKYTPKGGEISVMVSKKDGDVVSQITDNGYGIPKAQHGRVFEKFFRAENIAKVETDGTGLGLYLVKAIIESSGGKVWFESEEGKGTTFWFTLPLSGMKPKEGEVTLDD
jgi:signal transduction histidine kinase